MDFNSETRSITVDGQTYTGRPMTVDQADALFADRSNPTAFNRGIVAGTFGVDPAAVGSLPWPAFLQMVEASIDLNGLRAKGEGTAAAS